MEIDYRETTSDYYFVGVINVNGQGASEIAEFAAEHIGYSGTNEWSICDNSSGVEVTFFRAHMD